MLQIALNRAKCNGNYAARPHRQVGANQSAAADGSLG